MPTPEQELLLVAAYKGDLAIVESCLLVGADVNTKGDYGDTALNKASSEGHLEVVKKLIEKGADVNNKGGADLTPIMNAATGGHIKVVQELIQHGAIISDDLLSVIQMKVNILEENAENGMVMPQAVDAWKQFLNYLITERQRQDKT